jgi:hypothetical protein
LNKQSGDNKTRDNKKHIHSESSIEDRDSKDVIQVYIKRVTKQMEQQHDDNANRSQSIQAGQFFHKSSPDGYLK